VLTPAIFLDRDGTLSAEIGYVNHLSRFHLLPFAVEAVRLVNRAGWRAVVITNQAGVARGYFPESLVEEVHGSVREHMAAGGARLDGIFYCPHHPSVGEAPYRQDCACRKPKPGLLRQAAEELQIDLARSWMIGDRYGDLEVAWAVGARGALVRTGYGEGELQYKSAGWTRRPDLVSTHVLEAVAHILHEGTSA